MKLKKIFVTTIFINLVSFLIYKTTHSLFEILIIIMTLSWGFFVFSLISSIIIGIKHKSGKLSISDNKIRLLKNNIFTKKSIEMNNTTPTDSNEIPENQLNIKSNIRWKKIVAREFLILLSMILIFIATSFFIKYKIDRQRELEQKLETEKEQLLNESTSNRIHLYNYLNSQRMFFSSNYKYIDTHNLNAFTNQIQDSSIALRFYDQILNDKYLDAHLPTLDIYMDKMMNDKLSDSDLKLIKCEDDLNNLYISDEDDLLYQTFLILFFVFFILRYTVYGVIWSIKTLRR